MTYFRLVLLSAGLLSGVPHFLPAQDAPLAIVDSIRRELDSADARHDAARLVATDHLIERATAAFPKDPRLLHYRGYAEYLHVIDCFRIGKRADAAPWLAKSEADFAASALHLAWPETPALQAADAGMEIAIAPDRAMELSAQIQTFQARAITLGPNNPRVLLLAGDGLLSTPTEYGGGPAAARPLVEHAIQLYASDHPAAGTPGWGRDDARRILASIDSSKAGRRP